MEILKSAAAAFEAYNEGKDIIIATDEVRAAYEVFCGALDDYIGALSNFEFMCGYTYAVNQMKGATEDERS